MSVNEIKDFIFKNYYKIIGFSKESSYYSIKRLKKKDLLLLANKLIEKTSNPRNAKEHNQSFIRKKNTKSVKQLEIITYQWKTFENPNIVHIKSFVTEHPKTSHELSKAIRQAEKVGSNRSLYSDTKNSEVFLNKKKCKNNKMRTCF